MPDPTSSSGPIAAARLVLGADDAPPGAAEPQPTTSLALLAAGIDDWGGVSPRHARSRESRAAVARARPPARRDRGGGQGARAPAHRLPRVRRATPTRGSHPDVRFAVLGASDSRRPRARRRRGRPAATRPPPVLLPPPDAGARRRRRSARCSTACSPARRSASTRSSRCSAHAGRRSRAVAEVADELRRDDRRRRRHVRPQPQHQLHEHLHVQVPVLRVLEGPALAQPPRRPVPARARGDAARASSRPSSAARPRCACRAASIPTSTATTTSTWPGP